MCFSFCFIFKSFWTGVTGLFFVLCVSHFVLFLKAFGQELLDYFLEKNDLWMVKGFPIL